MSNNNIETESVDNQLAANPNDTQLEESPNNIELVQSPETPNDEQLPETPVNEAKSSEDSSKDPEDGNDPLSPDTPKDRELPQITNETIMGTPNESNAESANFSVVDLSNQSEGNGRDSNLGSSVPTKSMETARNSMGRTVVIDPTLPWTREQQIYIDNIKVCCDEYEGMDIFQIMAINTDKGIKGKFAAIFDMVKAFLCAGTQIFGIMLLLIDFVSTGMEAKGIDNDNLMELCSQREFVDGDEESIAYHGNLRVLSFLFSSFLAMYSIDHLNNVEKGLYKDVSYGVDLKWISGLWLRFGLSINIVVSLIAVYGSFLVVFFSTNALDMILNSVALFFIVELDDMLVQKKNYNKIMNYIENQEFHKDEYEAPGCCRSCLNRASLWIGCIYTTPFQILRYVTIFFCVMIPFIVCWCY